MVLLESIFETFFFSRQCDDCGQYQSYSAEYYYPDEVVVKGITICCAQLQRRVCVLCRHFAEATTDMSITTNCDDECKGECILDSFEDWRYQPKVIETSSKRESIAPQIEAAEQTSLNQLPVHWKGISVCYRHIGYLYNLYVYLILSFEFDRKIEGTSSRRCG